MVSISFCSKRYLYEASLSEYRTASRRLGEEVIDEDPYTLFSRRNSPVFDIISKLLGELPIVCIFIFFLQLFKSNFKNSFILGILRLFRTGLSYQIFPGFHCHLSTVIRDFPLVTRNCF
jgi:hypothetical protein